MGINISGADKVRLKARSFLVAPLIGSTGSGIALYHNPVTGQELKLPGAPEDIAWYIGKGFRPGPAPAGLVYTPDPDPMDDPIYNKNKPKATDGEISYVQQLEQRLAVLEGKNTEEKNIETALVEEQLPLF